MRETIYSILIIALINSCSIQKRTCGYPDIDMLWSTVDENYPFFDFKEINWDSIKEVYRPEFRKVNDEEKIILLSNMLNELKDGHVNLYDKSGRKISSYGMSRSIRDKELFDLNVVRWYLNNNTEKTEVFEYGITSNNIGYIYIANWYRKDTLYYQFDNILDSLKNTKGLVIDLRHNQGGASRNGYYVFNRLLKEPVDGTKWTWDDGSYTPIVTYKPDGGYQYTKQIVLLINGVSFSVSENIANLCKKVEHITVVGDTTAGGGGVVNKPKYILPSGLKFQIPTRTMLRYDDEQVEWNGIPPDIRVENRLDELKNNIDRQLEFAIDYLK